VTAEVGPVRAPAVDEEVALHVPRAFHAAATAQRGRGGGLRGEGALAGPAAGRTETCRRGWCTTRACSRDIEGWSRQ